MPLTPLLVGVDVGTTNLKVLAIDPNTMELVAHAARPVETDVPKPGYAEQNAEAIWQLLLDCMGELTAEITTAGRTIGALCFSTAMHSILAVDEAGTPLTAALIWSDNRASQEAAVLRKEDGDLYKTIGVPVHPMLPLCKLVWFGRHQPRLLKRAARWLSLKEYLWWKLTGHYEIDYAMASATGLFDSRKAAWHRPALKLAGINTGQLSTPVNTTHTVPYAALPGNVVPGLPPGTLLVIGASDGCLANLGAGAVEPGITTITIGTSGAVRRTSVRPIRDAQSRLFSYPLYKHEARSTTTHPDKTDADLTDWYVVGGPTNNGANVLEWLSEKLAKQDVPSVLASAATVPPGSEGLVFLPYLQGERAPLWNATARGSYRNLDWQHTQAHMVRAALEGVMFNLRQIELLLARHAGPTRVIHANGGFAQSAFWVQMMADVFGVPVRLNASNESGAIGAVLLARLALSLGTGEPVSLSDLTRQIAFGQTFQPDSERHTLYTQSFKAFQALLDMV
ncbi:gluconokinase [Fibrella forsythiae]|uniref:Gluconokinase n=1 Tax=Fibrella forsythiae TaxID=2817061 RepID=A0ABS3JF30_9BACT|nr:gluconokinase [Fibrella forsythiae]MBO0948604.1 gluconokinase [Fibrella forsythiae]